MSNRYEKYVVGVARRVSTALEQSGLVSGQDDVAKVLAKALKMYDEAEASTEVDGVTANLRPLNPDEQLTAYTEEQGTEAAYWDHMLLRKNFPIFKSPGRRER